MPAAITGVPDSPPGAAVTEFIALDPADRLKLPAAMQASKIQPIDLFPAGIPWSMAIKPPSWIPPIMSATQAPANLLTWKVANDRYLSIDDVQIIGYTAADENYLRLVRRFPTYHHNQAAVPAAAAAPTVVAAAQDVGMNADALTRSYKITFRDASGRENIASAASAAIATTTGNRRVSLTLPALPAGAVGYRIYRTVGGQAAGGPWYLVNEDIATPYNDVALDADLDTTVTAPSVATWNALAHIEPAPLIGELTLEVFTALTAAPGAVTYYDNLLKQAYVALTPAPALTVGTRYRVNLRGETRMAVAAPGVSSGGYAAQMFSDFGARGVAGFNASPAAIGGQVIGWIEQVMAASDFLTVPVAGASYSMPMHNPTIIGPGEEVAVQIAGTAALVTGVREVRVAGRTHLLA